MVECALLGIAKMGFENEEFVRVVHDKIEVLGEEGEEGEQTLNNKEANRNRVAIERCGLTAVEARVMGQEGADESTMRGSIVRQIFQTTV